MVANTTDTGDGESTDEQPEITAFRRQTHNGVSLQINLPTGETLSVVHTPSSKLSVSADDHDVTVEDFNTGESA